jgi:hypothetical protein
MDWMGSGCRSLSLGVRTGPANINMVTGCILACQCQRRRISCPTCYYYLVRAAWYRQFPPMSLMPQLFQLPYQRLPSPMQSAFVSSLVAHNPPLGTGAHRPSFPVGQPREPWRRLRQQRPAPVLPTDGLPRHSVLLDLPLVSVWGNRNRAIAGCLSSRACFFLSSLVPLRRDASNLIDRKKG